MFALIVSMYKILLLIRSILEANSLKMFNTKLFKGTRHYDKARTAITHLATKAPWIIDDYFHDTEKFLTDCGYYKPRKI